MSLSSLQLDAFFSLAQNGSFSKAALELHITQSALSQRILNLEDEVGTTLVIRESSGLRLTEVGYELLRYIQKKQSLEEEFRSDLRSHNLNDGQISARRDPQLSGRVRIASFSTVMQSVIFPCLDPLLTSHPDIVLESSLVEVRDLETLLRTGAADFIVSSEEYKKEGIKKYLLGYEENVLIAPKSKNQREDCFLDHDAEDRTTIEFLRLNGKTQKKLKRNYVGNIYGILEAVGLGWGKAVVPRHLLKYHKSLASRVQVVKGYKALKSPVWFYHYDQPYYTKLEQAVIDQVTSHAPKFM